MKLRGAPVTGQLNSQANPGHWTKQKSKKILPLLTIIYKVKAKHWSDKKKTKHFKYSNNVFY